MKKKRTPGNRARRRQKAAIKRLKREVERLQRQIQTQQTALAATRAIQHGEALQAPAAAMIYASELDAIREHVLRYPDLETGGSLFGWWSEGGLPVIALATGPGRNAVHGTTCFHTDEEYSFAIANLIASHGVDLVSAWHSHHRMALSHPSGIDCRAMQEALSAPDSPARRFLCGIANIRGEAFSLKLYFFTASTGTEYREVPLVVKGGVSPLRTGMRHLLETTEEKGA